MKRQGIIYDHLWRRSSGELVVAAYRVAKFAYNATKILASTLIVVGLSGLIITLKPIISSEIAYFWGKSTGQIEREQKYQEELLVKATDGENEKREEALNMARELGLPDSRFGIYIPKIGAKAPIIENVSTTNPKEYLNALKNGVAHASGSVFPGMTGTVYLFAHSSEVPFVSSQYNTIFYLLRELEPGSVKKTDNIPLGGGLIEEKKGDEIYIFFLDKIYKYKVTEKHTVNANDTSWLVNATEGKERLILQTCWPPGTALKRLIIVAEPVK